MSEKSWFFVFLCIFCHSGELPSSQTLLKIKKISLELELAKNTLHPDSRSIKIQKISMRNLKGAKSDIFFIPGAIHSWCIVHYTWKHRGNQGKSWYFCVFCDFYGFYGVNPPFTTPAKIKKIFVAQTAKKRPRMELHVWKIPKEQHA